MASKFGERLDRMVEAAKASDRPYKALEGKPFNLSASVARTLVVGSALSKSSDEVREREATRIARWREQGGFKPAAKSKAAEPKTIEIPKAAAVTDHFENATRKRGQRKDGQASGTAKAIARNREPVDASA